MGNNTSNRCCNIIVTITNMSEYTDKLQSCIDDKIIAHVLDGDKSISDCYLLYHSYITQISTLFYRPQEHYSKIMVLAYHKMLKTE